MKVSAILLAAAAATFTAVQAAPATYATHTPAPAVKVVYVKKPATTTKKTVKYVVVKKPSSSTKKVVYVKKPASSSTTKKVVYVKKPSTSSSSGSTSYTPSGSWQKTCVDLHNKARQAVNKQYGSNMPNLTWSDSLASKACACAQTNADKDQLKHCSVGENLWKSNKHIDSTRAITGSLYSWVNEEKPYYDAGEDISRDMATLERYGHYTQVVWKDTKQVGCCIRQGAYGTVVDCRYNPVGNYVGESAYGK
ncbi:hypothetical protein HDV00_011694 [Rhizophlyctis rosea]|nr:hypothetical protein HDV00_011694 [Rhizophlyctis rosea]